MTHTLLSQHDQDAPPPLCHPTRQHHSHPHTTTPHSSTFSCLVLVFVYCHLLHTYLLTFLSPFIVVLGAWKRWKARQVLRKKGQKIYKKHWNVHYLEYYYEDSRNRHTVWVKPLSLGSYDVDCAPGWCAMHDNEGDLYFYNPISWEMTWNQVIKNTLIVTYSNVVQSTLSPSHSY